MNYTVKDFIKGSLLFLGVMSFLSGFLIVNGLLGELKIIDKEVPVTMKEES